VQNSLFGEHGLGVAEISEITDIGDSKVRTSLKLLETKSLIKQNRIGRKYIYEADLDFINDIRR
jgi:predicted transcriptional regulator